ncbi:MAG TPA: MBL fold metallo-hydrolase [Ktedonobacteraceae bacterium]|nr:MBL fold metallo-hydrolase [Ktedonobacteraceae bacterium]
MSSTTLPLQPVDEVQIMTIMDNSFDMLMTSTEVAKRARLGPNPFERPMPIAEHGFSVLLRIKQGERARVVMFDTGLNPQHLLYNLDALEVRANDIQAIVLSHGHADHAMGLLGLAQRLGNRHLPLILHPEAYVERKIVFPNGEESRLPPPRKADLERENIQIVEEIGPSMLVDNMLLVSGEVARTTTFERGFPIHYALRSHGWEPDPLIHDDQCAIIHVRDKGLVIITGCGHSGIINIVRNAQTLTGIPTVYAIMGGFHLNGPLFEPIIPATIAALQEINPRYLIPGHCTGWVATHQIARALPEAFIANSVGTTLVL